MSGFIYTQVLADVCRGIQAIWMCDFSLPKHGNHSNVPYIAHTTVSRSNEDKISQGNTCLSGKYPVSPFKKDAKPCV